jgi:hypothetical protein
LKNPTVARGTAWSLFARHFHVIIPCALIVLYASPLIFYQIPSNFDTLSESFEPIKTLKFVHSKGRAFHKWGPMPNFIYAPLYAPLLAYWYLCGDLGNISTDYPYGFKYPFEQQGDLIVVARITGVVIASVSMLLYGKALTRMTGSRPAVFLALMLCMATSPELIIAFVSTKPDGLMLAFLAGSMAAYTDILAERLNKRRGFLLSILAVCSVSCKELTAPLYVLLYGAIAVRGFVRSGEEVSARCRFLVDYAFTVAVGIVAYLLINVVYAPATWRLRMIEWLWGPGKDPAVWASPGYTWQAYLHDAVRGALYNLGIGGAVIVVIALTISLVSPVKDRLLLWIPSAGFVLIVIMTSGYMPNYFLSPFNVAVALPVAGALAFTGRAWYSKASLPARAVGVTLAVALCLINMWLANIAWVSRYLSNSSLVEDYCVRDLNRRELIHTANLWVRQDGADRLSYLGFNVDDRPLGELMTGPERMPDVILIGEEYAVWIEQCKQRPARAAMLAASGFDYRDFPGFEALGYRMAHVVNPRIPRWLDLPGVQHLYMAGGPRILVYRRKASRGPGSEEP